MHRCIQLATERHTRLEQAAAADVDDDDDHRAGAAGLAVAELVIVVRGAASLQRDSGS